MAKSKLGKAIREVQEALKASASPPSKDPSQPSTAAGTSIWSVLDALKSLLELIPDGSGRPTRMSQCVGAMRRVFEEETFLTAIPDAPECGSIHPIDYPRQELNQAVDRTRHVILGLVDHVEVESGVRDLLVRELRILLPFLDADDRGSIGGRAAPTGLTREQQRNDWKLVALSAFLDALRRNPFAVVRYATRLLSAVAIPADVLSVEPAKNTVTFQGKSFDVSDATACFIELLLAANGQLVSSSEVALALESRGLGGAGQVRTDRLKNKLPRALQQAIITDQRGSRLDADALTSRA